MSEPNANAIKNPSRPATNVRTITSLAMLAAIAYVVMLLSKMLPQVSGFLQMDLKDTVICIGAFLFGPLSAAVISIVVAVVEMFTVSDTGPIGCIMNVLAPPPSSTRSSTPARAPSSVWPWALFASPW